MSAQGQLFLHGCVSLVLVCPRMTIRGSKQGKEAVTNFLATVAGSLRTLNMKMLLLISTEECWPSGSDDLPATLPFFCSEILKAGLIGTALPNPPPPKYLPF